MNISKLNMIIKVVLVFSILLLIGMIIYDYYNMQKTNNYAEDMINEIDKAIEENKDLFVTQGESNISNENQTTDNSSKVIQISGYNVYGKIKIDKIGIEYPIIEYKNKDALWKSICKVSKSNINGTGNLCLAGHNMRNLSMFGNLRKITNGDRVKITNLDGTEFIYEVYEKEYINPEQTEVLKNTDESIITLITCNDSSTKRLIVRGKLI